MIATLNCNPNRSKEVPHGGARIPSDPEVGALQNNAPGGAGAEGKQMANPYIPILEHGRRIVKAADSALWLRVERLAKWALARSCHHVLKATRHRVAHSDATHKAPIVRLRAWIASSDRN